MMLEKAMALHSSTLAWKIPWTEEPSRLQSMGSLRVGLDWATSLSLFLFMHWRRKWQPTPVFLPWESQGWGSWWAAVYGVAQSRTRLKWLSSSSSSRVMSDLCIPSPKFPFLIFDTRSGAPNDMILLLFLDLSTLDTIYSSRRSIDRALAHSHHFSVLRPLSS